MNTTQLEERFEKIGIVPVVVLDDAKDALPLAKALCDGGLPCAEITFRTAAAADSIRAITKEYPDMLVGAGTILTIKQVQDAVEAGASFIVCPGFDPEIKVKEKCFTPMELRLVLEKAGFAVDQLWGGTAGNWKRQTLSLDEIEIMVKAHKRA